MNSSFNKLSEEDRKLVISSFLPLIEANKKVYILDFLQYGVFDNLKYEERKNEIVGEVMIFFSSDPIFFSYLDSLYDKYKKNGDLYYQLLSQDIIFLLASKNRDKILRKDYFTYLDSRIRNNSRIFNYKLALMYDYDFGTFKHNSWESFQMPDTLKYKYLKE